jgi:sarcosine oxidase subunit beta
MAPPVVPSGRSVPPAAVADVVIVGAGVVGTSIAWHLATTTDLRVVVLERHSVGGGSTSRSAAAFRQQFSSAEHVRMSLYSGDVYRRFPETFRVDPVFTQNGYLFLYSDPAALDAAAGRVRFQQEEGVHDVRTLTPAEVDGLPGLGGVFAVDGLAGATWCPSDGFLDPTAIAAAFGAAARERGVGLRVGAEVAGVERSAGRVSGVLLADGERIACRALVVAAGWWSNAVSSLAACPIPVVAVKRYLYVTPQLRRPVRHLPLVVADLGPYCRPEHDGLLMGWDERPEKPAGHDRFPPPVQDVRLLEERQDVPEPGYGDGIDDYGVEILARLADVMPWLADEGAIEHVTCGYYEVTPDDKAILGEDPRLPGLFHASGFSGHGIMHAPAAGRAVADLLAGRPPPFDLDGFSLAPLLENRPRLDPERMVI